MKAIRILAVVAIAALVLAPLATVYAADKDTAAAPSGKKTEKVVTVVSVDPDGKTITVKDPGGSGGTPGTATSDKTLKVTGAAVSKLSQVRPGQQITIVFNDASAMDTISDLKVDAASGSATTPPPSH